MVPGVGGHILGKHRRKGSGGGIVFGNLNLHRRELGRQVNLPQTASFKVVSLFSGILKLYKLL